MDKTYLIIGLVVALALVVWFLMPRPETNSNILDETNGGSEVFSVGQACADRGGNWLPEQSECEIDNSVWCAESGGDFDECASACRHAEDPTASCIMMCVPVCSF